MSTQKSATSWGWIGDFMISMLYAALIYAMFNFVNNNIVGLPGLIINNLVVVAGLISGMMWSQGLLPGTTEYNAAASTQDQPSETPPNVPE